MLDFRPYFLLHFILLELLITSSKTDKVPSTGEIEDYKDPLIDEIFSSIGSTPGPPPNGGVNDRSSTNNNKEAARGSVQPQFPGGQDKIPEQTNGPKAQPPSSYGSHAPVEQPTFSNGANPSTNQGQTELGALAVQGAQNFYTGVQQAGRLFGIDSSQYQQYEVPLVSSAASLFGRK